MRRSGVLLHVSSLPSSYGIGSFGKEAYKFIDFLAKANQTLWQILPLGPTSFGDSPYQTFSAFANNPYFIDLDLLVKDKLIRRTEIISSEVEVDKVDYGKLYEERFKVLKIAFKRFEFSNDYKDFVQRNSYWLEDYALFMALKGHYEGVSWLYWDENIRLREEDVLNEYKDKLAEDILFYKFIQYKAFEQWENLKRYANDHNIKIIGDMPIYVSYDSADVWANPEFFQLDEKRVPKAVAGVPPDYFSTDGQLWGNPLYDWEFLKRDSYSFWVNRIKQALDLFDYIRIDHFIGFARYYAVPYGNKTAVDGVWHQGPKLDLFKVIHKEVRNVNIIAEDLGVITEEVQDFIDETGYPTMKVMQFGFDSGSDNDFLPHYHKENTVVYTGTHDNPTTRGWINTLTPKALRYCQNYLGITKKSEVLEALLVETHKSVSKLSIIPIQDYLNLDNHARMNTPSTTGNNWVWRLKRNDLNYKVGRKIKKMTNLYGRNKAID